MIDTTVITICITILGLATLEVAFRKKGGPKK